MSTFRTGLPRLLDHREEVAKFGVFQRSRQIAGGPGLLALRVDLLDALEGVAGDRGR